MSSRICSKKKMYCGFGTWGSERVYRGILSHSLLWIVLCFEVRRLCKSSVEDQSDHAGYSE